MRTHTLFQIEWVTNKAKSLDKFPKDLRVKTCYISLPEGDFMRAMKRLSALTLIIWTTCVGLWAAWFTDVPTTLSQADGSILNCFASGDEFHNWLHDKDGYTIILHPQTGYYVYAQKSGGGLVAGTAVPGRDDPTAHGLVPRLNISRAEYEAKRDLWQSRDQDRDTPTTGTLNNLIIYVRFSDQDEYTFSTSAQNDMYNSSAPGVASMRNYFYEESYQSLSVVTHMLPPQSGDTIISYQHYQPRNYFATYNEVSNPDGLTDDNYAQRRYELFSSIIAYVNPMLPPGINFDADGDGYIDNVIFLFRGSHDGWGNFLWPHKSSIASLGLNLGAKVVGEYNLGLEFMSGLSTACHEFTHTLGAPDLYHYSESSTFSPVGVWDIMAGNTSPPQHTSAFIKWKYTGWISDIPTLTPNQTYTLNPLTSSTNNVFRINSPLAENEYLLVEYRRKTGTFESSLPGSGMLVWRVKTDCGNGNADGPPDELYVYRPFGTLTTTGSLNLANFSAETHRTAFNSTTNPSPFFSDGSGSGVNIQNIGSAGETISFYYGDPYINFEINPLTQSFEADIFPPDGYGSAALQGTATFHRVSEGGNPVCDSYSGDAMLSYPCRDNTGGYAYLASPKIVVGQQPNAFYAVNFWMYRDEGYPANADKLEIYRNGLPNLNGAPVLLGTVHRAVGLSPVASSPGWHRYSFLINPPSNGNYYIVLKAISANGNDIYLDDLSFQRYSRAATTAAYPADNASDVSITTALSWTNSGPVPNGLKLYLGTNNPPSSMVNGLELPAGTYIWTNPDILLVDTRYYWQVVPNDEYGEAYQPPVRSFMTVDSAPLTGISYYEGFEVDDEYSLPEGWKSINANNDSEDWKCVYGVPQAGDKQLVCQVDDNTQGDDWAVSRGMTLHGGTQYKLSFYYRRYGQYGDAKLGLYYSTSKDPNHPKETVMIDEEIDLSSYVYYEQIITPAASGVYYFLFHNFGGPYFTYHTGVGIDEFLLRGISTAGLSNPQPAVNSVGVPLNVTFSWEVQSGSPTGYYLSLGTDNPPSNVYYRLDLGNTLSWTPPQNLENDEQYYWSVIPYDNYGEVIDPPVWTFFSELDNVIEGLPYTENFDSSSAGLMPQNWVQFDQDADGKAWKVIANSSPFSAPNVLRVERSTVSGVANDDWAISPPVRLYAGFDYELSFRLRSNLGLYPGSLKIALGMTPLPDLMTNFIYDNDNVNNTIWSLDSCVISPSVTGNYYIGFNCYSGSFSNTGVYLYLDDIQLLTTTPAQPVHSPSPADNASGITVNNGMLSWENTGDVWGYRINIGTDNPPTNLVSNLDIGNNKFYEHQALWPYEDTVYWQVIPYNSLGDSENNPVYSFTTMPEALIDSFPYYQDCEALVTPNLPLGYFQQNDNQDGVTWISRTTLGSFSSRALSLNSSELIADDWLFLPGVYVQSGSYYVINFRYRNDRNRSSAKLELYRGNQPQPSAMTQQLFYNDAMVYTNVWNQAQVVFRSSQTGIIYFGFHGFTSAEAGRINIDNLEILRLPTPVSDPQPANPGSGVSLQPVFAWAHAEGDPLGYRFYLGSDNPPTDIYNGIELGLTNELYYLENLSYNTAYYWKVVPYNSLGDAPECPTFYFTTMDQNTIMEFPYVQNFDSFTAPQLPYDWLTINANADFGQWSNSSLSSRSAPNSARLGSNFVYNSFDDWMFSPAISLSKGLQYRLNFYVRQAGYRKTDDLLVFLGSERNAADMNTQILQTTVSSTQDANFTLRQVLFSTTQSGAYYLGFHGLDSSPGTIFLDDVSVQQISSSLKPPRNLAAEAGSQSISLSWLDPISGTPHQFKLFRNGLLLATIPFGVNSFVDDDLVYAQDYLYFITAEYLSPEGESVESNHVYASLFPAAPLSPQGISLQVSESSLIISWQPVLEDVNGNPVTISAYQIYASETPDFTPGAGNLLGSTSICSYTHNSTQARMFFNIVAVKDPL